ncbi:scl-interrupting locus protein [Plakobranchus ocellatus]|uniref:Scl-interrupting locus protein n=1 Tax=Plakobranchus ocellatus TaxID=259542 RepID=A0AAV4ATJ8_9GAST|nr:scl-interrupting locus protein [Plakobranchus ocellatus]
MKTSLSFPRTSCSLWDNSAIGNPVFLHLGYYRKPKICIPEKILRLIQHQCENYAQTHHMLIGTLVIEDDGEGVQFQVDRLDTRNKIPSDGSGLAPGDLLIPLEVSNNTDKGRLGTVEDYHCALRRVQGRCCSKASVDLCEFVLLRGWGSYYSNSHSSVVHLDFDMVTMETVFKATPIPPVPILLTALSKNLAGPMSLSHMQGTTKTGYLSMDHTRKLLLVLESDPKACSLPLVGIWVSGAEFVQHPFIWASCLRYIHNTHLQDRVCAPPNEFLLVVYTPLHSRPEFYQCCPTSGTSNLLFQLSFVIYQALSTPCHNFTEVELAPVEEGNKLELFDAAKAEHGLERSRNDADLVNVSAPEDIEPRCVPKPHMEKVPSIRPMVPDVSILWTEPPELFPPQQQLHHLSAQNSRQQSDSCISSNNLLKNSYISQQQGLGRSTGGVSGPSSVQNVGLISLPSGNAVPSSHLTGYNHNNANALSRNMQTLSQGSRVNVSLGMQAGQANSSNWSQTPSPCPSSASRAASSVTAHTSSEFVSPANFGGHTLLSSSTSGYHSQTLNRTAQSPDSSPLHPSQVCPISKLSALQGQSLPQQGNLAFSSSNMVFTPAPSYAQYTPVSGPANLKPSQDWLHQAQAVNPVPSAKSTPHLATVVEESSSSSSQSSLSTSITNQASRRHTGISSSQSLGFNSTQGNGSSQNSSNSNGTCQSSDDDDSGLSVTPDRMNAFASQQLVPSTTQSQQPASSSASQSPKVHPSLPVPASAIETRSDSTLDKVRWDEVPPAVRALLEQQNQQLQLLQQQIQMLLHNQSQQSTASTAQSQPTTSKIQSQRLESSTQCCRNQSPRSLTQSHDRSATCSVGVNTTVLEDDQMGGQHMMDSRSVQTSPVKGGSHQNLFLSPVQPDWSDNHKAVEAVSASGNTPSELQHHSRPPISSTAYESPVATPVSRPGDHRTSKPCKMVGRDIDDDDDEVINQGDLVTAIAALPIQDQTMNTVASQLVVDMPEYVSSMNDGLNLDRSYSPPSVSECYGQDQDDSYSTVAEDAMDPKQYYTQLMNNIQMFLTNDRSDEADSSEDHNSSEPPLEIASPLKSGGASSANSSIIPRINYVSMMLGNSVCGTPGRGGSGWGDLDPGQSMEINAMAMKYLSDEQLTQMAMLRQMQKGDAQGKKTAQMLQMVLEKNCPAADMSSTADVTRLGISPNNMTMATQRYLEKHGLLGGNDSFVLTGLGPGGNEASALEHTMKLRTDFSMAQNGTGPVTPVQSPLKPRVKRTTQDSAKQNSTPGQNRSPRQAPASDLGASPVLKPYSSRQNISSTATRKMKGLDSPRHRPAQHQAANTRQNDSLSTEDQDDENILDIARLKQMPKLL